MKAVCPIFYRIVEKETIIMLTTSEITQHRYDPKDCVFFRNALQSTVYMLNGATLLDVIPVATERRLVFVFSREDHERLKEKWNNHEL